MRPITKSVTGVGSSNPITFDYDRLPFNVGYGCAAKGTVTYSVQHTFDDYRADGFSWANVTWFTNSAISGATTSQDGNYAYPVTAMRVTISGGSGTVVLTAIQA